MKKSIIIWLLASAAIGAPSQQTFPSGAEWHRFMALSMLESGDDDLAAGQAGEVGRYQITPRVWRESTRLPLSAAGNPFTSLSVARSVMRGRVAAFVKSAHRQPTDFEWALLWHAPARVCRPMASDWDYARRFVNLNGVK